MIYLLFGLVAFFCGAIPFGVIVAWLRGVDVRKVGSGNIGATNVARAVGRPLGVLVLLLDAAKAWVPLTLAPRFLFPHFGALDPYVALASMGFAAFLGHIYTPILRFKGGKGVATGLGVFLALSPAAAAVAVGVWILLYLSTKTSSIGSLVAVAALIGTLVYSRAPREYVILAGAMAVLIVWRHRGNIRRLLQRSENKV